MSERARIPITELSKSYMIAFQYHYFLEDFKKKLADTQEAIKNYQKAHNNRNFVKLIENTARLKLYFQFMDLFFKDNSTYDLIYTQERDLVEALTIEARGGSRDA